MSNISNENNSSISTNFSPLYVYGKNCIAYGLEVSANLKDSTSNLIEIKIDSGGCIFDGNLVVLDKSLILDLNLTSLDVNGYLLAFATYQGCASGSRNQCVKFHIAYTSKDGQVIYPETSSDLIQSSISQNIILGTFHFKRYFNSISEIINTTPRRNFASSYVSNPSLNIFDQKLEVMPFDRLTDRIALIIRDQTGGTGDTGGTGGTGISGGTGTLGLTGGTGSSGNTGLPGAGKSFFFSQCKPDSIWRIFHGLNEKYIVVQCIDLNDEAILPKNIKYISPTETVVSFGEPVSGYAICIGGKRGGSAIEGTGGEGFSISSSPIMIPGIQGLKGEIGDEGPIGPQGRPGCPGPPGMRGRDGRDGCMGKAGPQGPRGEQGLTGPTGNTGNTGNTGAHGMSGPPGARVGLPGPPGPPGVGVRGSVGERGDNGYRGEAGYWAGVDIKGGVGSVNQQTCQGQRGEVGDFGQGYSGSKGEWLGVDYQGRRGETTNQPCQGGKGGNGRDGRDGSRGGDGLRGSDGKDGKAGINGDRGVQGVKGDNGIGMLGPRGSTGQSGDTGDTGGTGGYKCLFQNLIVPGGYSLHHLPPGYSSLIKDWSQGCKPFARDGIYVHHVNYGNPDQPGAGERDAVWNIPHNLGVRFVIADFIDEEAMRRISDSEILSVQYIDENNLQVHFKSIKYGWAICVSGGGMTGGTGPTGPTGGTGDLGRPLEPISSIDTSDCSWPLVYESDPKYTIHSPLIITIDKDKRPVDCMDYPFPYDLSRHALKWDGYKWTDLGIFIGDSGGSGGTGDTGGSGETGDTGDTGDTGKSGATGATGRVAIGGQSVTEIPYTSQIWNIAHNLGTKYVVVECITDTGLRIIPKQVIFEDLNNIQVIFETNTHYKGHCVCVSGGGMTGATGGTGPTGGTGKSGGTGETGETGDGATINIGHLDNSIYYDKVETILFDQESGFRVYQDNPHEVIVTLDSHFKWVTDDVSTIEAFGSDTLKLFGSETVILDYDTTEKSVTFRTVLDTSALPCADTTTLGCVRIGDDLIMKDNCKLTTTYQHIDHPDFEKLSDALDYLLYVAPSITSFTNNYNTIEIGTIISQVTLNWTYNKPIASQSISGTIGSLSPTLRTYNHIGLNITSNTSYSLNCSDGTKSASRSTSITFLNKKYYSAKSIPSTLDSAFIMTLTSELNETRTGNFRVNAGIGQYIYYCYPKRLGTSYFWVGGFQGGFTDPQIVSFINSKGYVEDYYIYRSINPNLGDTLVTVT